MMMWVVMRNYKSTLPGLIVMLLFSLHVDNFYYSIVTLAASPYQNFCKVFLIFAHFISTTWSSLLFSNKAL